MKYTLRTLLLASLAIALLAAGIMYYRRAAEADTIDGNPLVPPQLPQVLSGDEFRKLSPAGLRTRYPDVSWFIIEPDGKGLTLLYIDENQQVSMVTYHRPVRLSRRSVQDVMAGRPVTRGFGLAE